MAEVLDIRASQRVEEHESVSIEDLIDSRNRASFGRQGKARGSKQRFRRI